MTNPYEGSVASFGGDVTTVLDTPQSQAAPATLEEARNQPGRREQIESITRRIEAEGIKYVFFQQVSITGRVMGKGVVADFFPQVAEKGYQLVYGATANLFTDRAGNYIGFGPEESELAAMADLSTFAPLPWDPRVARVYCDCYDTETGELLDADPRQNLKRVVAVAHVEAERLAVFHDVEEHRTQFLELVDVVAVGLGHALGLGAVLGLAQPHHLGLDADQELVPEFLLELVRDLFEVLPRVGVEQLPGLRVVAVAEHARDPLVPGQHPEGVEVGDGRELGLLGPEADVVALAIGEQVGHRAVDELIAALGDLREERGDDTLAHDPAGDRDLLEEDVLDPLGLDPLRQRLDALAAPGLRAGLLERRRRGRDPRAGGDRRDGAAERGRRLEGDAAVAVAVRHLAPFPRSRTPQVGADYTGELSEFVHSCTVRKPA